jgi:hypothetical protein
MAYNRLLVLLLFFFVLSAHNFKPLQLEPPLREGYPVPFERDATFRNFQLLLTLLLDRWACFKILICRRTTQVVMLSVLYESTRIMSGVSSIKVIHHENVHSTRLLVG